MSEMASVFHEDQPVKRTAIIYCRTSTKGQRDEKTIDAQIAWATEVTARDGVVLLPYGPQSNGWIVDDGVSGSLLEGRALKTLIDDIEAGQVRPDVVYAYSLSRTSREDRSSSDKKKRIQSRMDAARIVAVLGAYGVLVRDESGLNDPNSLAYDIKTMVSTEEYRGIRDKTMRGKARVLGTGAVATGGRPPYGYERVPVNGQRKLGTTYAPHPVESDRLRQILAWYVEGGVTHAARLAQAQGWPSPRGSKTWYPATVEQITHNAPAYTGKTTRSVDGKDFVVTYPALLDDATYTRVQARAGVRVVAQRALLLGTGLCDCAACGAHVQGAKSNVVGSTDYMVFCGKREAGKRNRCGSMKASLFERALWEAIVARYVQIRETRPNKQRTVDEYTARIRAVTDQIAKTEAAIATLADALIDGMDKAVWRSKNDPLNATKAKLEAEREALRNERDEKTRKIVAADNVYTEVSAFLTKLRRDPPLAVKRDAITRLVGAAPILVGWPTEGKGRHAKANGHVTITLPPWADRLPAVTVRLDGSSITQQVTGLSRDALETLYEAGADTVSIP